MNYETNLDQTGQHYMIDKDLLKFISNYGELERDDIVLEIGPGHGELTKYLVNKCKIIAVDIDPKVDFISENLIIVKGNILEKFEEVYKKYKFNKIISNIPYNISEPLMKKIFKTNLDLVILTAGKKFADLLTQKKLLNTNRIGIIANKFYDIELLKVVKPKSFYPKPKTDSGIIRLIPKDLDNLTIAGALYKKMVLLDDKKIKNILEQIIKTKTKKEISNLIKMHNTKIFDKRLYQLTNEEFLELDKALTKFE